MFTAEEHFWSYILTLTLVVAILPANPGSTAQDYQPVPIYSDVFIAPDLPDNEFRTLATSQSLAPSYYETSEYLLGSVAVGIILMESNGSIDPSTEDWTSLREPLVISQIRDNGLPWLANFDPDANVTFIYDIRYRVPTSYEPINHPQSDQGYWISDAMNHLGYADPSYFRQVRDYINDLRITLGTDWAFAVFVVDSLNDPDGCFADDSSAYAYLGGPFLVMTYDNGDYGIEFMDYVIAHETAHIFYATDEYNGEAEISGYLGIQDFDGAGCMMERPNSWHLCTNSQEQLGWRDTDEDGIHDILDTFPDTTLEPYAPDPTNETTLTYYGSATVIPYPNSNPFGSGRSVTLNTLVAVEFRVDGEVWQSAVSNDTMFNEPEEIFFFTTQPLYAGIHTVEARATNSVGNPETSYSSDQVTVAISTQAHALIISATGGGSTSPIPGTYVYAEGTNVLVTAFPDPGYGLDRWELNATDEGSVNPFGVSMNANYSLTAIFVAGQHDIAPTNITLLKTIVGQGKTMGINVTVENQGDFTETFGIILYGNASTISIISDLVLTSNNSATIMLKWNSTGFAYGHYNISAYTPPVLNENETFDNSYVKGLALVTIPGDVDGDIDVDIYDMVAMAGKYASNSEDPDFVPNYDIDNDNDVDIFDIVIAASNYGKSN